MKTLEAYVDDDDAGELEILFANEQDFGELSALLKVSDYFILHHAAECGKFDALRTMIETFPFEAMGSRAPYTGRTLLMGAAERGQRDLLWLCHDALQTKCRRETECSAIGSVRHQLGYETEIDRFDDRWKQLVNATDRDGTTPLLLAVKNRHLLCVGDLLKWEAAMDRDACVLNAALDVLYECIGCWTASNEILLFDLVVNAWWEDMYVEQRWYKQNQNWVYGIDPHHFQLMRILGCCVTLNDGAAIRVLLSSDQDVSAVANQLTSFFASPVIRAVRDEKFSALQPMLELLPIDVLQGCEDETGFNVLMQAAECGRADVIMNYHRTMRDRYVGEHSNIGQSYLSYAASALKNRLGLGEKVESFDSYWQKIVNAQDKNGDTALLLAIKNKHELCVRVLLALRANIYIKNDAGESSLSMACGTDGSPAIKNIFLRFLNPEDQPHTTRVGQYATPGEMTTASDTSSKSSGKGVNRLIYEWDDEQAQKAFEAQVQTWVARIEQEVLAAYVRDFVDQGKLPGPVRS